MLNKRIKIKNIFQFVKIEDRENLAKTNVFWFSLEFVRRFRNNWCLDILVLYNWRDVRWSSRIVTGVLKKNMAHTCGKSPYPRIILYHD